MNDALGIKNQHSAFNILHSSRGFTLIETVVALGIFVLTMTIASSIFVSAQKVSHRTVAAERIGGDARFVMEQMVEDIRLATIAYDAVGGVVPSPAHRLPLVTADGDRLTYERRTDAAICGRAGIGCVVLSREGTTAPIALTAKEVNVERLDFWVWPTRDPFALAADDRAVGQPRVTIVFTTTTVGSRKEEQSRLSLQTTVSSRVYKK